MTINRESIKSFDELAEFQSNLRSDESYLMLFVTLGAINRHEAANIWNWAMDNSDTIDKEGLLRIKLLPWLHPDFVQESLTTESDGGQIRVIPERLQKFIALHAQKRRKND